MKQVSVIAFAAMAAVGLSFAAAAEDAYIQTDGTQYVKTDYFANPSTKIVCDFAYTSATPVQQRVFGADKEVAWLTGTGVLKVAEHGLMIFLK